MAPERSSVTLIGFSHDGDMIILDADAGSGKTRASIAKVALPAGPRVELAPADALDVRTLQSLEGWIDPIRIDPSVGSRIRTIHFRDGQGVIPFALRIDVDAALGDRRQARALAILDDIEEEVLRISVGRAVDAGPLFVSPDGRYAILAVRDPPRESLYPIDIQGTHAALLNRAALAAYAAEDHQRAAAIFERAIHADPRSGDPVYNLACVHALMGDADRALDELQLALAIDPARYALLARNDPDLEAIRARPEVCARLSSCDRKSQ